MSNVINFSPLPPWQRSMSGRLRKKRELSHLSCGWFMRHGPFRARITRLGGLVLEHDEIDRIPSFVMQDLKKSLVLYYANNEPIRTKDEDGRYKLIQHELRSWLVETPSGMKFAPPMGMHMVPKGVTAILIVSEPIDDKYLILCLVREVEDLRRVEAAKKTQSGG